MYTNEFIRWRRGQRIVLYTVTLPSGVCICELEYVCVCVHVYMSMHVCLYVCMYIHVYMCMCTFVHTSVDARHLGASLSEQ